MKSLSVTVIDLRRSCCKRAIVGLTHLDVFVFVVLYLVLLIETDQNVMLWSADVYQCQTVKLMRWVMAFVPFKLTVSFVFCQWFYLPLCQHYHRLWRCAVSLIKHSMRPCFFHPHPSIKAPSVLIRSAMHLLQWPLVWFVESGCPSPHMKQTTNNTHTSPHCPPLVILVRFKSLISVGCKIATQGIWWMRDLCGQWPTWILVCNWWLQSITSATLFTRHQVTFRKSGSKEQEVGEWTDLTYGKGRAASEHLKFSFGSPPRDKSQQHWS